MKSWNDAGEIKKIKRNTTISNQLNSLFSTRKPWQIVFRASQNEQSAFHSKSDFVCPPPLQAVCRSLWSGFGCEWASDQGGPAGVPGGDESSLPRHAHWALRHHEWTGLMNLIDAFCVCSFYISHFMGLISFCYWFLFCNFSNFFSHCSYKKVFLPPAPLLSLTALCPLFLRLVCHLIIFHHERRRVTLLTPLYPSTHILTCPRSQTASLDTNSALIFFLFNLQIPHTRQPGMERHSAYWMSSCLKRRSLCQEGHFSLLIALDCQFEPQRGALLLVFECGSFPLQANWTVLDAEYRQNKGRPL